MRADSAPPGLASAPPTTISVNGIKIAYRLQGPAGAPVVLFSNSLATNVDMWAGQAAALAGSYRLLRYDTRGHGGSDAGSGPYSIELLSGDVIALLDALAIKRAAFVALSLGGMIAQYTAARHPERFSALVLCDTALRINGEVWGERIKSVQANGVEPQVEPSLGRWFTAPFRERNPEMMEQVRRMIRSTSSTGYCNCAAAMRATDLERITPAIKAPTMVIVGAEDPSTPPSAAEAIHAALPHSRYEVIDSAAHLPNMEQPSVFNHLLKGFLAQHART
jgi:3-oxoadipate enol-lactonase